MRYSKSPILIYVERKCGDRLENIKTSKTLGLGGERVIMGTNSLRIDTKDGKTMFVAWIVECSRERLTVVCIGEGSIGEVRTLDRSDILEPRFLSFG